MNKVIVYKNEDFTIREDGSIIITGKYVDFEDVFKKQLQVLSPPKWEKIENKGNTFYNLKDEIEGNAVFVSENSTLEVGGTFNKFK